MNRHRLDPHVCVWCERSFESNSALRQHQRATRHSQFTRPVRSEEHWQRARLQEYHQDLVGGQR